MPPDAHSPAPHGSFPTTHWSVVLHAGEGSESQARAALETLCGQYWYPLYVFVRRQGRSHHEAEDCTQDFLTRLVANAGVANARRERGRFRSFLLTALRNHLTNEWHRSQTTKRGGGRIAVSLDLKNADERFAHEPADQSLTPEQVFDRAWAVGLIDQTLSELQTDYEQRGSGTLFSILSPLAWGANEEQSNVECASRAGLTAQAFTVALHRLRRRLGERLRARVAETVADGADVNAELRHLINAVSDSRRDD
jgi:RNA polymerase sigma-70 factor (ECF subfamily)